jgi:outer membrane protein TolC
MNISYKIVIFLLLSVSLNATTLKEITKLLIKNSSSIKSINYSVKSKEENLKSVSNTLNPTINAGATYNRLDMDVPTNMVGTTAQGYIKFGADLYDGGKSVAIKRQKRYELLSAKQSRENSIKDMILQAITLFYQIKQTQANIKAYEDKAKSLYIQYKTQKQKYDIKMVTIDEVLKFKSEYDLSIYTISELKYQKESLFRNLSVLVGKKISTLDDSKLKDIAEIRYKPSSYIKSLKSELKSINENINIANSAKKLKIKVEDTLSIYGYNDYDKNILKNLPDTQNKLMLTFSINLFDTQSKPKKQSAIYAKLSKKEQLSYEMQKEKTLFELAKDKLITQQEKIRSAKSAYESAKSVYEIIYSKFKNSVVDNVTYLDALSKKTLSWSQYQNALYEYEIAKANYYFLSGKDMQRIFR